jgi:hypothetical protein
LSATFTVVVKVLVELVVRVMKPLVGARGMTDWVMVVMIAGGVADSASTELQMSVGVLFGGRGRTYEVELGRTISE